MTAEEARKLTRENEVIQRLIDNIDRRIAVACNGGNYGLIVGLRYNECAIVDAVCSHYRSLGYTVTADPHNTYTAIEISWK